MMFCERISPSVMQKHMTFPSCQQEYETICTAQTTIIHKHGSRLHTKQDKGSRVIRNEKDKPILKTAIFCKYCKSYRLTDWLIIGE